LKTSVTQSFQMINCSRYL